MIYTILNTLPWLLVTVTFSESLTVNISGNTKADCGQPVTLHCTVSSSLSGLSIKHMEWSQSQTYCSVDNEGSLAAQTAPGDFRCHYEEGRLTLHIHKWQPQQSETPFMCKVRSNQGISHDYTQVKTNEYWDRVEASWNSGFPYCTFTLVCPGGEVDWFQDSTKILNQSLIITKNYTEDGRLFTIHSYLKTHSRNKVYNCRLKSIKSGQYMAKVFITPLSYHIRARAAAHGPSWLSFGLLVGFIVEKYSH